MKKLFFFCAASLILFSGCIDIYFDIIRHNDGSYTMKRTLVLGQDFLGQMQQFQSMAHDTTQFSLKATADSIMGEFKNEKDIYLKYDGVTSYNLYDSTKDSLAYIISEVTIKDKSLLDELANEHFLSMKEKDQPGANRTLQLKLSSAKKKTTLEASLVPQKDLNSMSGEDIKLFNQYFGTHAIHFRVFSPNLDPNISKDLTTLPGGQEWKIPFSVFPTIKKGSLKKVKFVIKD